MKHVRPMGVEHPGERPIERRRAVGVREGGELPAVDDLVHGHALVGALGHAAVGPRRVVLRADNRDLVARLLGAAQRIGVQLRARAMARQEVVDGVEDPHQRTRISR